jgi:hypothetical protein
LPLSPGFARGGQASERPEVSPSIFFGPNRAAGVRLPKQQPVSPWLGLRIGMTNMRNSQVRRIIEIVFDKEINGFPLILAINW